MKICVLSGSPKGKNSVTLQTVRFLEQKSRRDEFTYFHVGQRIRSLERDMTEVLEAISRADILLLCYPVYTFIVPSQLHRFIELLKESGTDLSGKCAVQICTSKHFYDVTAMRFITDNFQDMGIKYLGGLSADMDDLLSPKGRREAADFWKLVHFRYANGISLPSETRPSVKSDYERCIAECGRKSELEVVIVTSAEKGDVSLENMIADFRAAAPFNTRVVNISDYPMAGGCLGCFNCAATGKCIYKDGFDDFLRNSIQTADAIIYAFSVKDHSMGSRMKMYDDRQFCNGHRTVTMGKPIGYIVCGDLSREENLCTIMTARADVGGNFLAGTASDSEGIRSLAKTVYFALKKNIRQPQTFYGVGGMKIFRDLIWVMQGMMKADHEFYKAHGLYDFPQNKVGTILKMKLVGALVSNPELMKKAGMNMTDGMLMPYEKIIGDKK